MRRTVTSLAYQHHDMETFKRVGQQQNHSTNMALKSYTALMGKDSAKANFEASENVKACKLICDEAARELRAWFGTSTRTPFPDIQECEQVRRQHTTHKKYLN